MKEFQGLSMLSSVRVSVSVAPARDAKVELEAPLRESAMRAHYAEYLARGKDAHVRAHHGAARAAATREAEEETIRMGRLAFEMASARLGGADAVLRSLRRSGLGEEADKLAFLQAMRGASG